MSKSKVEIEFKNEKLIITENNKAKYYISKVKQIDKNDKEIKSNLINENKKSEFREEDIHKNAIKLQICVKTNNPIKGVFARERYYLYEIKRKEKITIDRWNSNSGYVKVETWDEKLWLFEKDNIDKTICNEIIDCFLIRSPSAFTSSSPNNKKPVTRKSINIYDYWGESCFNSRSFEREYRLYEQHKIIGLYENVLGFSKNKNDLKNKIEARNLYEMTSLKEFDLQARIAMVDSLGNRFCSFLRHIRNALAHGTFVFYRDHFIFQDQIKSYVTGRGVIKIETLLFVKKFIVKDRLPKANRTEKIRGDIIK